MKTVKFTHIGWEFSCLVVYDRTGYLIDEVYCHGPVDPKVTPVLEIGPDTYGDLQEEAVMAYRESKRGPRL